MSILYVALNKAHNDNCGTTVSMIAATPPAQTVPLAIQLAAFSISHFPFSVSIRIAFTTNWIHLAFTAPPQTIFESERYLRLRLRPLCHRLPADRSLSCGPKCNAKLTVLPKPCAATEELLLLPLARICEIVRSQTCWLLAGRSVRHSVGLFVRRLLWQNHE